MTLAPAPSAPILLAASATPVTLYGAAGAAAQTAASVVIKGGAIRPGSILDLSAHFDFLAPPHAGRSVFITLGSQLLGQTFPAATVGSVEVKVLAYVAPDLQSFTIMSTNLNTISAPVSGQGAPFSALSTVSPAIPLDMTQDQTFAIKIQPVNDDIFTLTGFALTNFATPAPVNYAPTNAVAVFSNSLGAGVGSQGAFVLSTTASVTAYSVGITLGATAGVTPGQVVTGPGIPPGTIMTSQNTMSQVATATASGISVKLTSGPWPQQLMYAAPGRAVFNNSVAGTTSAQIAARQMLDKVRGIYWTQLWVDLFRNDYPWTPSACLAAIAPMQARLAPGTRWAVSTIIPAANEPPGGVNWLAIAAANSAVLAAYPSNTIDVFAALTAGGTTNIPLKYRNCVTTVGAISSGSNSLTVGAAAGLSVGMYVISPGAAAIDPGSAASSPTITAISGTTITLSSNAPGALGGQMVSFISPTELHLNDVGYAVGYLAPVQAWLAARGA